MVQGGGRKKFSGAEIIVDEQHQRLFVEDGSRILIFDVDPRRLTNYPDAALVIGQPDFESRERGLGPNRLTRAHGIALDPDEQRLFVSDQGNNRILVFDVHPDRLANDPNAVAVLGQPDFFSNAPRFAGARARPADRRGLRSITPGGLDYDRLHKRLFVSQLPDNRILVFEAAPDKLQDNLEAFAVVGQPDFETFDPVISPHGDERLYVGGRSPDLVDPAGVAAGPKDLRHAGPGDRFDSVSHVAAAARAPMAATISERGRGRASSGPGADEQPRRPWT